ncbi:MAG TPA: CUAEP/CCAEP-tail radical SAM protein [Candidatus Eremiobacteraceae bacterium]|nr:CUAEP/CCAEP-tail radical SAM protein [Candidatus Eremiobacteraceae bacterium]
MKIILISTYELGRQPFGLASPAAWLRVAGHDVSSLDLTRQSLDEKLVCSANMIAIYLPMHTATRLAAKLIPNLREKNPQARICCYGLYAPMNADYLRSLGVEKLIGGEFERELVNWANSAADGKETSSVTSTERLPFVLPDRSDLPLIEKYAHLVLPSGGYRIVGSTEASRGCKHLCRHCPIVPVYKGIFRIVGRDVVMEDVRRQIAAGAQHISFGDPDFLNGVRHAIELIEEFHNEFQAVTYDATIKIEHLRKHEALLPKLRDTGCLFVTSAVESVDDATLAALDKGHTRADFLYVARKFRELGMTLHPTFVPFTPWTTIEGYLDLLRVLCEEELVENVVPVQLGIRLLIPEGSRMLELEEIRNTIGAFDRESLVYPWKNSDPRMDLLSEKVQGLAATADSAKWPRAKTYEAIWKMAHAVAGEPAPNLRLHASKAVPFLSEPWYCCAEPTKDQLVSLGAATSTSKPAPPLATSEGFV